MAKYLKISSNSVTTKEEMFTLGVSTSRGDVTKIGQFGTGSFMGTLCWMRHYHDSPVFAINGEQVEFDARPKAMSNGGTFHQIFMLSEKDGKMDTSLTSVSLEHGAMDWKTPELGLREWVSNALDNGANIADCLQVVNEIDYDENQVVVFVPYTDAAKKYWKDLPTNFLHFRGLENETMIPKDKRSLCRIYRKGVFVRELEEMSLFDYNLEFDINECRTGSSDSLIRQIEEHICYRCSPENIAVVFDAILNMTECVETHINRGYMTLGQNWKEFLENRNLRICMPNITEEGAVPVASGWYSKICKVCPSMDALDKAETARVRGFKNVPVPQIAINNFEKICAAVESFGLTNGRNRPKLECYVTHDGVKPDCLGYCDLEKEVVAIWEEQANSLRTMVHEVCHHYSKATDWTSAFQDYAHNLIAVMIE